MNKYAHFSKADQVRKNKLREKKCLSKKPYESFEEAQKNGAQLIYKCQFCKKFHGSSKIFKIISKNKKINDLS